MSIGIGDKRFYSFQLKKYWNGHPIKYGVVLTPGELSYLSLKLDGEEALNANLEVVTSKSFLVFKKENKAPFYLPNAALDKFKEDLPKLLLLAKNQSLNNLETAEIILRSVILEVFSEELVSYKKPKYLEKATIIGKFFNISKEVFEEVIKLDYSDSKYLPAKPEVTELFEYLFNYNKALYFKSLNK